MSIQSSRYKHILLVTIIGLCIAYLYKDLRNAFFQQDEWLQFGNYIYSDQIYNNPVLRLTNAIWSSVRLTNYRHLIPLYTANFYLQFQIFKLHYEWYAYISIFNQIINSVLTYIIVYKLTKNYFASFTSALLFGVSTSANQSITWIAASISDLPAMTFLQISMILMIEYITQIDQKLRFLFLSICAALIGLMFKETDIILFILLPLLWYIFTKKKHIKNISPIILGLFGLGIVYLFFRVPTFINHEAINLSGQKSIQPWVSITPITYLYRIISFPLKVFPQTLFSDTWLIHVSEKLIRHGYPYYFINSLGNTVETVSQTIAFDMVCYVISFLCMFALFILNKQLHEQYLYKCVQFALILIAISVLPLIFIEGKVGYATIFEPRYLYTGTLGTSILISAILMSLKKNNFAFIVSLITCVLLIVINMRQTSNKIRILVDDAQIRMRILKIVDSSVEKNSQNILLYTKSDYTFYGISDSDGTLPFQSGFGQTYLVWRAITVKDVMPPCMFQDNYLYDIDKQGYRYCEGRGYGYVRSINMLNQTIKENNIQNSSIFAFNYSSARKLFLKSALDIQNNVLK